MYAHKLTVLALLSLWMAMPAQAATLEIRYAEPCTKRSGAPLDDLGKMIFEVFKPGTNIALLQWDKEPTSEKGCGGSDELLETSRSLDLNELGELTAVEVQVRAVNRAGRVSEATIRTLELPEPPGPTRRLELCLIEDGRRLCNLDVQLREVDPEPEPSE